ncbi:hypothetical protein BIU92_10650 [Curtobacterium sp. MCBA15_003]|nr:hypothetical protein BIU92_10650 [Curtobacterium sp. MCBA15_003]OII33346.1 hypothetical protein BIU94_14710 [Curtobacterium sp. MMLR14_006]
MRFEVSVTFHAANGDTEPERGLPAAASTRSFSTRLAILSLLCDMPVVRGEVMWVPSKLTSTSLRSGALRMARGWR